MSGPAHRRGPPTVPAAIVQAKGQAPRGPVVPAAIVQAKGQASRGPVVPAAIVQAKVHVPRAVVVVPAAIVQAKVHVPRAVVVPAAIVQAKGPAARGPIVVQPFWGYAASLLSLAATYPLTTLAVVGIPTAYVRYQNQSRISSFQKEIKKEKPESFSTHYPKDVEKEKEAITTGKLKRVRADSWAFWLMVKRGRPFIWTLDVNGELYAMDGLTGDPKHTMSAMGLDVFSAGVGQWVDDEDAGKQVLEISNVTGHYQASGASLKWGKKAFEAHGYPVTTRDWKKN
jgi:hypothetical protein